MLLGVNKEKKHGNGEDISKKQIKTNKTNTHIQPENKVRDPKHETKTAKLENFPYPISKEKFQDLSEALENISGQMSANVLGLL